MARYQQAKPGAVAVLGERLNPQLYRFFASQLGNRADAEDMVQDTWLRFHRVRHTYRAGDPVLPCVYPITRRVPPPGEGIRQGYTGLGPPEGRLKQIQAAIKEDLRPVRPLASSGLFLLAFMLVSLVVVAIGPLLLGVNGWNALSRVRRMTIFAVLTASVFQFVISVVRQMTPGAKHSISRRLLPIGILAGLILATAVTF